jgi:Divergent InlB B-repeat domain
MAGPRNAARFAMGSMTLLVGLLLTALLWAGDAHAATQWTTPVRLGTAEHEFTYLPNAQVAVSPKGEAVAVWANNSSTHPRIYAATRSVGRTWSTAVPISPGGRGAQEPRVGIDAAGNATVIWESFVGSSQPSQIEMATKGAGSSSWSSWSSVAPLEIPCGCSAELQFAVSAEGVGVAAWVSDPPGEPESEEGELVYAATMLPGGLWSTPTPISGPALYNIEPDVAIDGTDNATAVWVAEDEEEAVIEEATAQVGNVWSSPVTISDPPGESGEFRPKVAVDPAGDAAVVWLRETEAECGCLSSVAMGMSRPAGGSWSEPAEISPPHDEVSSLSGPKVGLDGAGAATAVWTGSGPGGIPAVEAANSPEPGTWSTSSFLEPEFTRAGIFAQVAVAPNGRAVAIWDGLNEEGDATVAATMSGGSWSTPQVVSNSSPEELPSNPQVAFDEAGNATAVWEHFSAGTGTYLVETAELWEGVPLTVKKVGTDGGTIESDPTGFVCGPECHRETAGFEEGSEVVLIASPAPGYSFVAWTNCDSGSVYGEVCVVQATEGHEPIGAEFRRLVPVRLLKTGDGTGKVLSTPTGINCRVECVESTGEFRSGKKVVLQATPSKTSTFEGWSLSSGSCMLSEEGKKCAFTPREYMTAEAAFSSLPKVAFSIAKEGSGQGTIKVEPGGYACGATCGTFEAQFFENEKLKVTVTPRNPAHSLTWIDGAGTCVEHALTCQVPAAAGNLSLQFE